MNIESIIEKTILFAIGLTLLGIVVYITAPKNSNQSCESCNTCNTCDDCCCKTCCCCCLGECVVEEKTEN